MCVVLSVAGINTLFCFSFFFFSRCYKITILMECIVLCLYTYINIMKSGFKLIFLYIGVLLFQKRCVFFSSHWWFYLVFIIYHVLNIQWEFISWFFIHSIYLFPVLGHSHVILVNWHVIVSFSNVLKGYSCPVTFSPWYSLVVYIFSKQISAFEFLEAWWNVHGSWVNLYTGQGRTARFSSFSSCFPSNFSSFFPI